jgi:choline dehydrogenase-like flavoprotein
MAEIESSSGYDVVVVGGGTAGCVLAARLSSRAPHLQFLLLEAGPDNRDDPYVRTPLLSRRMFGQEKYDWKLRSAPQKDLDGRVIEQTRGKMLGGSSAINSHSLVYPNREMHDAWAELVRDPRWAWDKVKDCYTRFQHVAGEKGGPIAASYPRELNQVQRAWNDAFAEIAAVASSPTAGQAIGGSTTTNAIDDHGQRSHAGAYLNVAGSNLTLKTVAHVEKIVFQGRRAVGVNYRSEGQHFYVKAKEVILCAGVFGSPQLLELSGIGQREILRKAGIEQMLELSGVGGKCTVVL